MCGAYQNCRNLTTAVCGPNVTNMSYTYYSCINLTTAICGPNVTNMYMTYQNCTNLTTAVCGPNVTSMCGAYQDCANLTTAYLYSKNITNVQNCFAKHNNSIRLDVYIYSGKTNTNTSLMRQNSLSVVGKSITWTASQNCQFNTTYNIYIYPVANIDAVRIANGDPDYMGVI
jgi:hypothetical protein